MNDDFSNIFSDFLMEGFGEDPSKVIQRVGLPAPGTAQTYASDEYSSQPSSMESAPAVALGAESEKPGPTQTPLEAPVVKKYGDGGLAERERAMFLESYAGLSAFARNNASDPGYRDVGSDTSGYTYRWYANNTYKVLSGPKNVGKTYTDTSGKLTSEFGPYSSAGTTASTSSDTSSKKKGLSVAGSTALGAGIGAGLGELATRMAVLLGPQSAVPLTDEELAAGTVTEEPSSGLPWGWIIGGVAVVGVLVVGGIVISRSGKSASSEE